MRTTSSLGLELGLGFGFAVAALVLMFVTMPAPAEAQGIKGQRAGGAASVTCKSGKKARHAKGCKENGGKK